MNQSMNESINHLRRVEKVSSALGSDLEPSEERVNEAAIGSTMILETHLPQAVFSGEKYRKTVRLYVGTCK